MLVLDIPMIGLDVVAQHTIREFLRDVQRRRRMTVILTAHYNPAVVTFCKRAAVITRVDVLCGGSLAGIVERFTTHKVVMLDLDETPDRSRIEWFWFWCEFRGPQVILRIERSRIADALPEILGSAVVRDVPLEEIVAELFRADARGSAAAGAGR